MPRLILSKKNIRPPLNSAEFNLREIAKQYLLLEDHLTDPDKYCIDCIRKHLMMTEALAEESIAMDSLSPHVSRCEEIASNARHWIKKFNKTNRREIAHEIRLIRKDLVKDHHDPS